MAFLKSSYLTDTQPVIQRGAVFLRVPQMADFSAWAQLRAQSRAFLTPFEPLWTLDDLTKHAFRNRLRRYGRDIKGDISYPYFIFRKSDNVLLGGITLSNIRRGVAQSGMAGYWIGAPYARKGYMTNALNAMITHAFDALSLHRLEASCLPYNQASIALLEKCGFEREGYASSYLKIDGKWQDHLLFAIIKGCS